MGLIINPFTGQLDLSGTSGVTSVNGQTGVVVLTTDNIPEGTTNQYHTIERAQDAVGNALVDSSKIDFTYDDALNTITATVVPASLTNSDISPTATIDASKIATGVVSNTEFVTLDGVTSNIQTQINSKINLTEKAANNGVATLDAGGKIPANQLPNTVMEYQGNWNASTNTPILVDGIGNAGDVYRVNVAGTQNLGSGSQTFAIGDFIIYSGPIWQKSINSNAVVSVNGQQGVVVLNTDNITEGGTNLYFTNSRAQAALVGNLANKANTNLNNLISPVALNQDLLPDTQINRNLGNDVAAFNVVKSLRYGSSNVIQSFIGDTTNGSPTVLVANTTGLYVGLDVVGSGIPTGTVIISIVVNTSIVISANADATATGVALMGLFPMNVRSENQTGSNPTGFAVIRSGDGVDGLGGILVARTGNITGGGTSGGVTVRSGNHSSALNSTTTGTVSVTTGSQTGTGATGSVTLRSGNSNVGSSGNNTVGTGTATTGNSGQLNLNTGNINGSGSSGTAILQTGTSTTGSSGPASVRTGNVTAGIGNSGRIDIITGTSAGGQRGFIQMSGLEINILNNTSLKFFNAATTQAIAFVAPTSITTGVTYTLPEEGLNGQVLTTNGGGLLSWSSIASSANTSLSNLVSPTAINQDLIFNKTNAVVRTQDKTGIVPSENIKLFSGNTVNAISGNIEVSTGQVSNITSTATSGAVLVKTGDQAGNGASGDLTILTGSLAGSSSAKPGTIGIYVGGAGTASAQGGDLNVSSGAADNGTAGTTRILSGSTNTGTSGTIQILSGNSTTGNTGSLDIRTGDSSTGGVVGNILLQTGTTSGIKGSVQVYSPAGLHLNLGTPFRLKGSTSGEVSVLTQAIAGIYNFNLPTTSGTIGQVLTSGGGGAAPMTWSTPGTFATTALDNLGTTSINANLLPSAAFTRDLGSTSLPWNQIYGGTVGVPIDATHVLVLQSRALGGIFAHPNDSFIIGNFGTTLATSRPTALVTQNNTNVNTDPTQYVGIFTGNKTAGTGNSGRIEFKTGTSSGGTRGRIIHDAAAVELNVGTPLIMEGSTSGAITIQTQAASGTFNFNLPITPGTLGQPLLSGGGGLGVMAFGILGLSGGGTNASLTPVAGGIVYTDADSMEVSAAGTTGQYLKSNGASAPTFTSFGAPDIQSFSFTGVNATYTTPANALYLEVELVGGGAGGAGGGQSGGGAGNGGSGGVTDFMTAALALIVRGAGGGNAGLNSTGGGTTVNAPAVAVKRIQGQGTGFAAVAAAIATYVEGVPGGHSPLGYGGGGQPNGGGIAAIGFGAGGGGGGTNANVTGTDKFGGAGGGAGGYVKFIIPTPSATYVVNVGGNGAGGAAGTNGFTGNSGSPGQVIITARFQ